MIILKDVFLNCVCLSVCVSVEPEAPLETEVQVVLRNLTWVLGTELVSHQEQNVLLTTEPFQIIIWE